MKLIETQVFKSPLEREYYKQKVSNAPCNHFKKLEEVKVIIGDGYETYYGCPVCRNIFSSVEAEEIKKRLEEFKRIK